jgi:hypothetical protein
MRFTEHTWSELVPLWTPLTIEEPPVFPPPIIYGLGPGCDNWDCIWVGGRNFEPYSRLIVASANWGYQETYYGPAWQTWPPLNVSEDGWWLSLQIVDANLRSAFGGDGVYVLVLNSDGNASSWAWVQSLPPTIASATPSCADFYCITFTGSFPQNAYVDFRIPGTSEVLPNAYSDLVVTSTQITLRLNPSARSVFDTSGLNAWVVNPALANWSSLYYLPPVDRSVIGWFSGVSHQGANHYLYGWACAKTFPGSIDLHVYVGGPAGGGGTFAFSGPANQPSEPAVAEACTSSGSNYRFWVQIPPSVVQQHMGSPIYVYGISPFGYSNLPLNGSGSFSVPGVLSLNRREYIYFGDRLLAVDAP